MASSPASPARKRAGVRLDQIACPSHLATEPRPRTRLPPSRPPPLASEIAAMVLTDGQVTGMVTVSDLQQALRRRTLTTRR